MRFLLIPALLLLSGVIVAWEIPINLGDSINTGWDEWYPVLAEDGSFMIFVSNRAGGIGSSDIWISHWSGETWGTPENLGTNVNTPWVESAPYLADNDSVLYFLSMEPTGHGGGDIWYCDFNGGSPSMRVNLGSEINTGALECCPLLSHDGSTIYFCSTRIGGSGENDVWISKESGGSWGTPYNAGTAVNTSGTDCPRWISGDDGTVLICSTWPGGYGNSDMYTALVVGDSLGTMENMGSDLNSQWAEWGAGFLDNSGTVGGTIFFGSGRPGGQGNWDIWYSTEYPGLLEVTTWGEVKTLPEQD